MTRRVVVTGVFSYTGGAIARQLLDRGDEVVSLSRRAAPPGHPLAGAVAREPLQFDDPEQLVRSLEGADVLFNTYWIRFPRDGADFASAVANSRALFEAGARAGVRRIVHLSVTNAAAALAVRLLPREGGGRGRAGADHLGPRGDPALAGVRRP
jgi:nucleoside-diphosphate-sugar epimerase